MRAIGRFSGIASLALAAALTAACASGGAADGSAEAAAEVAGEREAPRFDTWRALFRHYIPRAQMSGECVANIGRGTTGGGGAEPPVIEIDGQRSFDGCPPPGYEPEEIVDVEMFGSSEAGMLLGSRGAGGLIRMSTE